MRSKGGTGPAEAQRKSRGGPEEVGVQRRSRGDSEEIQRWFRSRGDQSTKSSRRGPCPVEVQKRFKSRGDLREPVEFQSRPRKDQEEVQKRASGSPERSLPHSLTLEKNIYDSHFN